MSATENSTRREFKNHLDEDKECRLSKRLCYILRYGALKEGLDVLHGGGFIQGNVVIEKRKMSIKTFRNICFSSFSRNQTGNTFIFIMSKMFDGTTSGKHMTRLCYGYCHQSRK
jgi:hypothetical protein